MNPKQALAIFWSRRSTIGLVFLVIMGAAVLSLAFITPRFVARAQLFVNLADPNAATNASVSGAGVRSYISTQVEAIRSPGTAAAVAVNAGLVQDPKMISAFKQDKDNGGDIAAWVGARLIGGLEVARQGLSDVISVSYRSSDPETAARIANAFADTMLLRDIEIRNPNTATAAVIRKTEEELVALRARYSDLEGQRSALRLAAIRRGDVDATGTPDPTSSMTTVLANARSAVIQARTALDLARSGQNPPPDNPEILQLRKAFSEVELNLRRELPLLGPEHRRTQALQSNMQQLQKQIASAVARLRSDMVADRERELAAAEQRVADAMKVLSSDETQRHDQAQSRAAAASLDRELESLKSQIDSLVQRRERTSSATMINASNISILSRATVPTSPAWPRIPILLGLAAALGVAFGFALAFLREMFDRRVRCVDDLSAYISAPVLGVIEQTQLPKGMAAVTAAPSLRWQSGIRRATPPLDSRPLLEA